MATLLEQLEISKRKGGKKMIPVTGNLHTKLSVIAEEQDVTLQSITEIVVAAGLRSVKNAISQKK